jgi:transcriptional regulator with XRE-family HTH domain
MSSFTSITKSPRLQTIYGRNLSFEAYRRGWSVKQTAEALGTTEIVIHRIRQAKNVNIDAEILGKATKAFGCDFNALLLPRADLVYED